jgi:hypothetical protein
MATLKDQRLRERLRADHTVVPPITVAGGGPLSDELTAKVRADEAQRLGELFDQCWATLAAQWPALRDSARLDAFRTWRDKLIAHSELHHTDGKYHLLDLSKQGLKWADLGELVMELQVVVDSLQCVTRAAGFAWDMLTDQLGEASRGFWDLLGPRSPDDKGAV